MRLPENSIRPLTAFLTMAADPSTHAEVVVPKSNPTKNARFMYFSMAARAPILGGLAADRKGNVVVREQLEQKARGVQDCARMAQNSIVALEAAEVNASVDLYCAASADLVDAAGLSVAAIGHAGLLTASRIDVLALNRLVGLGLGGTHGSGSPPPMQRIVGAAPRVRSSAAG